ncbi:chromosome partitioning protein [Catenulispora rubra]|uniref:chromosome partitioning protein n=1 Tax=Catenulispora rubra TaxID=280293 RepID=UPI0018927B8E|nr:chromosome partitioning protein [Catenulispora rubra]
MLIALGSLKSSPGVTTAAAALSAMWPASAAGEPVLLEADARGGDVAARFSLGPEPGLASLSVGARRATEAKLLAEHVQELPGGLNVVLAPPTAENARAAMTMLDEDGRELLRALAVQEDFAVVADLGDLSPDGHGWAVAEAAEVLLLVARPVLDELTRVISAAEDLLARCAASGTRLALVTVGAGPFSRAEIEESTGITLAAELPNDAAAAAMLAGRPDPRGALSRLTGRGGIAGLPLAKAATSLAVALAAEHLRVGAESHTEPEDGAADGAEHEPIGASA